jgi:hypothetical protein
MELNCARALCSMPVDVEPLGDVMYRKRSRPGSETRLAIILTIVAMLTGSAAAVAAVTLIGGARMPSVGAPPR